MPSCINIHKRIKKIKNTFEIEDTEKDVDLMPLFDCIKTLSNIEEFELEFKNLEKTDLNLTKAIL